jgi:hypothetical protein
VCLFARPNPCSSIESAHLAVCMAVVCVGCLACTITLKCAVRHQRDLVKAWSKRGHSCLQHSHCIPLNTLINGSPVCSTAVLCTSVFTGAACMKCTKLGRCMRISLHACKLCTIPHREWCANLVQHITERGVRLREVLRRGLDSLTAAAGLVCLCMTV